MTLRGTSQAVGRLDGFKDADESALILTHPFDGYFSRSNGRLGKYAVWHPRLQPTAGHAEEARYAVFEELDLISHRATPHSVMLQRQVAFDVRLPPVGPR